MELRISKMQVPEKISFNYDELKRELLERVSIYESTVYTDDSIKQAKADKASLNKLKKALNDERIKREREYMKPFDEFKRQINEIISIIDQPIKAIDGQVKAYEDKRKREKEERIQAYYETVPHPVWLPLSRIFNMAWLNTSYSMKAIQGEIGESLARIETEMKTLDEMPGFAWEAKETYKRTLNLGMAIQEGKRLADIQARKEAYEAQEGAKSEAVGSDAAEPEKPVQAEEQPVGTWVNFTACLTVEQALELKEFFKRRGIEFHRI